MAQKDDLQTLLQLAQLSQVVSAPAVEQQRLSQGAEGQRLQSALAILGLQQEAQQQAEDAEIRRAMLAQGDTQFAATLEDRGLDRAQAAALAERGFGQGDRRLDLDEVAQTDAARQAWAQISNQRDLGERGLRVQEGQLAQAGELGRKNIDVQREQIALQKLLGEAGLKFQGEELAQRGELGREGMNLQRLLGAAQMMSARPDADMRTLGELIGAVGGAPVAEVIDAGRKRAVEGQVRGQAPAVSRLKDAATWETLSSTLDPEVASQLKAFLPPDLNPNFSLLPASWNAPTTVTPGAVSRFKPNFTPPRGLLQ